MSIATVGRRPLALAILLASCVPALAQTTPEEAGFTTKAEALATGEEISRQSDLWVMEVRLKPMRMVNVEITDPKTGEKTKELVWYVVYQGVNRPLAKRTNDRDTIPVNVVDDPPGPPLFVPEFTIVATDAEQTKVYHDEVLPEALAAINRRERKNYANIVKAIQPIPAETPYDALQEKTVEGVAMFRGIDPETDFFTLLASGFSNGFQVSTGPDGEPLVWRKTLQQKYWRPGDRFNQNEDEFRFRGEPGWTYRPDEPTDPLTGLEEAAAGDEAAEE